MRHFFRNNLKISIPHYQFDLPQEKFVQVCYWTNGEYIDNLLINGKPQYSIEDNKARYRKRFYKPQAKRIALMAEGI